MLAVHCLSYHEQLITWRCFQWWVTFDFWIM